VAKGQPVCLVETQKSSVEVEAPGPGTLLRLYETGAEVELGKPVALVCETPEELERERARRGAPASPPPPPGERKATRKAVELAERHGIDLAAIDKRGFITEADVEALIGAAAGPAAEEAPAPAGVLEGVSTERVSLPALLDSPDELGLLDEAFLETLRADPESFRALSPEEKASTLRDHGAAVGEDVALGEGTLVAAPRVVLEDGVSIGAGSTLVCDEALTIGALTHFGAGLDLRCRRAHIGAGVHGGARIQIGGGGHRDPWALLAIGDLAFVGDEAFVNVCRPVLIGAEVFLTMRSMIVTHNIGHSMLEGYENRFAPVVLEDRSQVGLGTVVYAGCRIGEGAIVGSSSYVVSDIPPGKLAIGVPAKVAGAAARPVARARQVELVQELVADLRELLVLRGHPARAVDGGFELEGSAVRLVERVDASYTPPEGEAETILLTLELAGDPPAGTVVLDLLERRIHGARGEQSPLLDATRELCRKRGMRLEPGPWRYRRGLI